MAQYYPDAESGRLEFKEKIPENQQIIKTIIGFCNQFGGRLVIGVANNREIVGVPESKIDAIQEQLSQAIYQSCSPTIIPHLYSQRFGEKLLLIVSVTKGMKPPYFMQSKGIQQGTYVRVGRNTLKANLDMIEELRLQGVGKSYDQSPLHYADRKELDLKAIAHFLQTRKRGQANHKVTNAVLQSYSLTVMDHQQEYPTVGAALLFSENPQRTFPEAFTILSQFEGAQGRKVNATQDCTGTLFEQADCAYEFVLSRLSRSFEIKGKKRVEILELPEEAIREVIMNMMVHRDYHIAAPNKIALYTDRIEFFSPGIFPGPIDEQDLEQGISFIRNPVICKIFREAGYMEKLGSGLITLFQSYREAGLKKPSVIQGNGFVKCILPREKEVVSGESWKISIVNYLQAHRVMTSMEVCNLLAISKATAIRRMRLLIQEKRVRLVGKGAGARYELA